MSQDNKDIIKKGSNEVRGPNPQMDDTIKIKGLTPDIEPEAVPSVEL